ncbi:MAG: GNAT family N-acetyltransferase [Pseudomonadota bacterium]
MVVLPPVRILVAPLEATALDDAKNVLARASRFLPAATVAAEKLFGRYPQAVPGVTVGAWLAVENTSVARRLPLVGVMAAAGSWIRLLAVDPSSRGQGIGTALLAEAARIAKCSSTGTARLRTGDQPGNYLAPGVDDRDEATIDWLLRRGFRVVGENHNMSVPLRKNELVSRQRSDEMDRALRASGYQIRRAQVPETHQLAAWVRGCFSEAWAFEVERALANGPHPGVHVALAGEAYVAFAAHDGNNQGLGWFGPAGTLAEHRGRGIGQALLLRCLLDVAGADVETGTIAWIGPLEFYRRTVGAIPDRRFLVLERQL